MKRAKVDGVEIPQEAVQFELERLAKFYVSHGFSDEEIKKSLPELREKALEQAIGARLLLDRAAKLDIKVEPADVDAQVAKVEGQIGGRDAFLAALAAQGVSEARFRVELEKAARVEKLVAQACAGADEPSVADIESYYSSHRDSFPGRSLAQCADTIRDLLRHVSRGRAMDSYVAELREEAEIEYFESSDGHGGGHCGCGGHGHGEGHCGCGGH